MTVRHSDQNSIVASRCVAGAELSVIQLSAGRSVSRVEPTFFELCHVIQGSVVVSRSTRADVQRPADYIARTGAPLAALHAEPDGAMCLFIHLDKGWPGWKMVGMIEPAVGMLTFGNFRRSGTSDRILRILNRNRSQQSLTLAGLVFQLLGEVLDPSTAGSVRPAWLDSILNDLNEGRLAGGGLDELARKAGVSRAQLVRSFKSHVGCSVGEYVMSRRLARARSLLADSTRSIAEIAIECGFGDQSHLTRAFRGEMAMSPRRYRESRNPASRSADARPFNPVGHYSFSSATAAGIPYDGEFEIQGTPGAYSGFAVTPVLPPLHFNEVLVVGQRLTILVDVPGGLAVISVEESDGTMRGIWQLGSNQQPLSATRLVSR